LGKHNLLGGNNTQDTLPCQNCIRILPVVYQLCWIFLSK